jgi:hypothetical protein
VAFGKPGCESGKTALVLGRTDCKLAVDLAEVGSVIDTDAGMLFRRGDDGVCRPGSPADPMTAFAIGNTLPAGAFPTMPDRAFGEDRLQARLHAASDGITIRNARLLSLHAQLDPDESTSQVQPAPYVFFDTGRQTPCAVTTAGDGTLRCVPTNTVPKLGRYFADSACARPAHLGSRDPVCPSSGFVALPGWQGIGDLIPPLTEIRPIGAVLPAPPYTVARDIGDPTAPPPGTCVQEPVVPLRVFYALGDPIAVAALPIVIERTE